jgi:ribosomal protein S12 methylthiotransferase
MRGLYRSEPIETLLHEAGELAAEGVKELILIGQETTSYGVDLYRERKLVELCEQLSEIEGIEWLRLMYAHPPSTPPYLLEQLARIPCFLPYVDYPIEHASDRMLKQMNRRTTAVRMKDAIKAFREACEKACVRTTVLVGFPGESEADFETLCEFMSEIKFERAGVFTYSPQSGTAGAELPDRVDEGIALDRLDRLMKLQQGICHDRQRSWIGQTTDVLIERTVRGFSWGRSIWDAPEIDGRVRVQGEYMPGMIIPVKVEKVAAYQLSGVAQQTQENTSRELCGNFALPVLFS